MKGKCAILLVRVSTEIQDYEPQLKDLEKYAKDKGFTKLKRIETKESGLADAKNKVGLLELYKFIDENPEYSTVFATEMSRLARRQTILHDIREWLVKRKIQLFLKDTGYSLFDDNGKVSAAGDVMFTLYGYFAESEMKQKKERFIRKKKQLMELGLSISGKTLFGYSRVNTTSKRTTLIPHEENAEIVRKIFNWYLHGIDEVNANPSIKAIALHCLKLGFPKYTHSKRNINKLLKEDGYTGEKTTNNKRKNPNYEDESRDEKYLITNNKIKYPKIIEQELYQSVQKRLIENNSKADKSHVHTTILSRLIKCPVCGNHFNADYRIKDGGLKHSYRCSGRAKANPCNNKQSVSMVMIDSVVWSLIKTDLRVLADSINKLNPDIDYSMLVAQKKAIQDRLDEVEKATVALNKSIKANIANKSIDISEALASFNTKVDKLAKEKGQLEKEFNILSTNIQIKDKRLNNIEEVINSNLERIEHSKELLKRYINYFVESVELLLHNNRFTVLLFKFKNYSLLEYRQKLENQMIIDDGEYLQKTFVIINKRNTNNIKAIKSTRKLEVSNDNEVNLGNLKISIDELFKSVEVGTKTRQSALRDIKQFEYKKLGVY
jgi:DNA invertase Pin-like site-specific DNA recombinase